MDCDDGMVPITQLGYNRTMNTLTETDKAYLAGFIDGEGCISITKSMRKESRNISYRLAVIACQSNYDFLAKLREQTGVGSLHEKIRTMSNTSRTWDWRISSQEAANFLTDILPYLRIKKTEAELAIEFQHQVARSNGKGWQVPASVIEHREAIYQQMRQLKGALSGTRGRKRKRHELYS